MRLLEAYSSGGGTIVASENIRHGPKNCVPMRRRLGVEPPPAAAVGVFSGSPGRLAARTGVFEVLGIRNRAQSWVRGKNEWQEPVGAGLAAAIRIDAVWIRLSSIISRRDSVAVWLFHLFLLLGEEPMLRRQFEASYERCARSVRRWLPGRT